MTEKTYTEINDQILATFVENTNGDISATDLKNQLVDMNDSYSLKRSIGYVNILDYGASTELTDNSSYIQAALDDAAVQGKAVYVPPGTWNMTEGISLPVANSTIFGAGKNYSILRFTNEFEASSMDGAIVLTPNQPFNTIRDLRIDFEQPDTDVRANLYSYPPAIYGVESTRVTIQNVQITACMDGIFCISNCGGMIVENLEMSSFGIGIYVVLCLDSVKFSKVHMWPFNLTANQQQIFYDQDEANYGMYIRAIDDFKVSDSLFFRQRVKLSSYQPEIDDNQPSYPSSSPITYSSGFGNFSNVDFDAASSLIIGGGSWNFSTCYFSLIGGLLTDSFILDMTKIDNNDGTIDGNLSEVTFSSCTFTTSDLASEGCPPLFRCYGKIGGGDYTSLVISNSIFRWITNPAYSNSYLETNLQSLIDARYCNLVISNNSFWPLLSGDLGNGTRTSWNTEDMTPLIELVSVRSSIVGNVAKDWGTPAMRFVQVKDANSFVTISNNTLPGYRIEIPDSALSYDTLFGVNVNSNALGWGLEKSYSVGDTSNMVVGSDRDLVFTGTTDASGNAVILHDLDNAGAYITRSVKNISCMAKHPAGGAMSVSGVIVDGSQIVITGGPLSAPFRVYLTISGYIQPTW